MITVYKYPIPMADDFSLSLPKGARVLDVQVQNGDPVLWALVDTEAPLGSVRFRLAGTGHPIDTTEFALIHIGTFQIMGGLVFHLFEKFEPTLELH